MVQNFHIKWDEHSAILLSKLHIMQERKSFVDITLATDEGLSIQVHRVILCAASSYFEELLSQHPEDARITIILSDINFDHLTALVEFIYKGKVSVPCCRIHDLIEAASSLKIKGLADAFKNGQQQHDRSETYEPESERTLLKIVSVKSIAHQMQFQSDERMSWDNTIVKEEFDYDSDATVVYELEENDLMFGDGAPDMVNELQLVPFPKETSTDSTGRKSDRSSSKRKKIHQQHSPSKASFPTRYTTSKSKSSAEDEEGSSRKRSLNAVFVKRHQKEPQQVALDFTVLGDGTPPAPIIFKRDPCVREEKEEEQEEKIQNNVQCEELAESDSDYEDAASQHSSLEDVSLGSSDEEYGIASTSTVTPKKKARKSTRKLGVMMERKQKAMPNPANTVSKGTFKCSGCGRVYRHKKYLNAHVKNECGKGPSFSCWLCNYQTLRKSDLKKHLIRAHGVHESQFAAHGLGPTIRPETPFKCHKCLQSYKSRHCLNDHQSRCGVDPAFHCTQCDYRTKQRFYLRNHLTDVHGISPIEFALHGVGYNFQCNLCPFHGNSKPDLQKHTTKEHAGEQL